MRLCFREVAAKDDWIFVPCNKRWFSLSIFSIVWSEPVCVLPFRSRLPLSTGMECLRIEKKKRCTSQKEFRLRNRFFSGVKGFSIFRSFFVVENQGYDGWACRRYPVVDNDAKKNGTIIYWLEAVCRMMQQSVVIISEFSFRFIVWELFADPSGSRAKR